MLSFHFHSVSGNFLISFLNSLLHVGLSLGLKAEEKKWVGCQGDSTEIDPGGGLVIENCAIKFYPVEEKVWAA